MITVKDVIFSDPNINDNRYRTLVVLFSNNRYQSVTINHGKGRPKDIADALIELGNNILNDSELV